MGHLIILPCGRIHLGYLKKEQEESMFYALLIIEILMDTPPKEKIMDMTLRYLVRGINKIKKWVSERGVIVGIN